MLLNNIKPTACSLYLLSAQIVLSVLLGEKFTIFAQIDTFFRLAQSLETVPILTAACQARQWALNALKLPSAPSQPVSSSYSEIHQPHILQELEKDDEEGN